MKRLLTLVVAFLLAVTFVPFAAGPASADPPPKGATFNVPPYTGKAAANFKIVRSIESAIDSTRPTRSDPRPVIHIATYFLDRNASADALIRACKRGVSVRVILDSGIQDKPAKRLIATLNADNVRDSNADGKPDRPAKAGPCNTRNRSSRTVANPEPVDATAMSARQVERSVSAPSDRSVTWGEDGSYVKRCKGSCRGGKGAMHSKFFVFSQTGRVNNVVMVSSSNLNLGGAIRGWNDMITFQNRAKLRDGFVKVHRAMTQDRTASRKLAQFKDGAVTARFFPMRGAGKSLDPTLRDMNKIRCSSAFGRTQIRVSMFYWAHDRGKYLAAKLIRLAKAGCRVSVIYGAPGDQVRRMLNDASRKGLINLYDSRRDQLADGDFRVRTHGKFMLVQGTFDGNRRAFFTMTGSQNWAYASLGGGDEVTVNVLSRSIYKQYRAHYDRIRKSSFRR